MGNRIDLKMMALALLPGLMALAATAGAVPNGGVSVQPLPSIVELLRPSERPAMAVCSLKNNNGTAMAFNSAIASGDRYASFINPAACTGTDDYPMAVYWVSFPLYHFTGAKWPVGINVQFWSATGADSCQGPATPLYSYHVLCDSTKFAAPHVGVVTLPSPVCMQGPFFVTLEYDGSTAAPYPSVLFDTQVPGDPCVNWAYRHGWNRWDQFFSPPGAGNFMVWIDGFSNSSYCATEDTIVRTIEGLHADWPAIGSERVTVTGYYTDSADGKLVSNYEAFLANSPMPPQSELMLVGPRPDSTYQGDLVRVSGYLQAVRDPDAIYPNDTMTLRFLPYSWATVLNAPHYPEAASQSAVHAEKAESQMSGCDSCKYGIYLSGGVNEANDHARYWTELVEAYGTNSYWNGICDNGAYVLYSDGLSRSLSVPQNRVSSLTVANVNAAFDEVSHRVANCTRKFGQTHVNIFVSGQGSSSGVLMLGGPTLNWVDFRSNVQKLFDSGLVELDLTSSGSYGGILADSLKSLDDKQRGYLNIHTAAGNNLSYSSASNSAFSRTIVDSTGTLWDYVFIGAALNYRSFVDSLLLAWQSRLSSATSWLLANPVGTISDTVRIKVVADSLATHNVLASVQSWHSTLPASPRLWTRRQYNGFGYSQWFVAPPDGQLALTYSGPTTSSGNVTVYKDSSISLGQPLRKTAVWTWNIPGTAGYAPGNEFRILNGESGRRALFIAVNDSRNFTATADMYLTQPFSASASNPYDFAGFSMSVTNNSALEFGNIIAPTYSYSGCELPGVRLDSIPAQWGSSDFTFGYNVPALTPWHADMEFDVVVTHVTTPGTLSFKISGMTDSVGSFTVNAPGTFKFDCHATLAAGPHTIEILPTGALLDIDSWALRSKVLDPPSCCLGTTGDVNGFGIVDGADLAALVSYLTSGGFAPPCAAEANVNGAGIVDGADLAFLVAYLTGGGAVLPSCP